MLGRIKGWCRAALEGKGRQASDGAVEERRGKRMGSRKFAEKEGDLNSLRWGHEFFTGEFVCECRIGF